MERSYPEIENIVPPSARVKVVGVGGGGVNTAGRLVASGSLSAEAAKHFSFAVVNTDMQSLGASPVAERLVIGRALTRGLGAGGEAEIGRRAAEADRAACQALVAECDLVILLVALGGGTGSGAAPVIAEAAEKAGARVIAFVTLPFSWEGERRTKQALAALEALRAKCHAAIPLRNDMLLQGDGADADVESAFDRATGWICAGLDALASMIFKKGLINIDFATLRNALPVCGGVTLFGVGRAAGENRHREVVASLFDCPLLHTQDSARTADTLIVHIVGGPGLSLARVNGILESVKEKFGGAENTVFGAIIDESRGDELEVCVLGSSGIARKMRAAPARTPSAPAPEENLETENPVADHASAPRRPAPAAHAEQPELPFDREGDFFPLEGRTLIDGQDIDSPTFQRRHIHIRL